MSRLPIAMGLGLAVMAACADPDSPLRPNAAKVPSGPAVTAADPSYGRQGAAGLPVTITGSGFDQGSRASWERNGATDPKIAVVATQFVSSTQLIATIDIASDANLALYDVAVTTSLGRKGIGTEKFEVSTALAIAGTESAFGANERGEFAGRVGPPGAFYWSDAAGLVTVGTPGRAFDISEDGLTLTGFTGVCCQGAFVQVNVNGAWNLAVLPRDPAGSAYSSARAIASDPATGAAVIVGGLEAYLASGGNFSQAKARPRLWLAGAGGWTRVELPAPGGTTDSPLFDVNASGVAVGSIGGRAAVWTPNGGGGWAQAQIGPSGSQAWAVNASGDLAVGFTSSKGGTEAQYWQGTGSTWAAFPLPGGCTEARDVDDLGRILANGCQNGNRRSPAIITPPYGAADVRLLSGLGATSGSVATAYRMSTRGSWVAGDAPNKGGTIGVRWPGN